MDFMKVFDQTVREIKREVNIKVLKVPEMEQKVLDATSDEPWGPHGSDLAEIAKATKKITECQLVMNVLWTRLTDTGKNWRHVYKALAVIEYLVSHGSERAVDDIIEHTFQISSLSGFLYAEPNGKDMGINVRKKAEAIASLLDNKDKIQEIRNKAAANRDKYVGLSSTGITYKSNIASNISSSFQNSDRYGGFGAKKETFKDSYCEKDRFEEDGSSKESRSKLRKGIAAKDDKNNVKKSSRRLRDQDDLASDTPVDDNYGAVPSQSSTTVNAPDGDFDDFDPRGTSTAGAASVNVNEVDFFGDLMDAPASTLPGMSTANGSNEVDLFADADFVSASSHDVSGNLQTEANVDLFASQPGFPSSSYSSMNFFAAPDPVLKSETKSPENEPISSPTIIDPFASMPLNSFDGSDLFGAFTAQTDQVANEPAENSLKSATESRPLPKKNNFQVKSGIWADSLSRGLIDLNITAPKKTNLADIEIVGGLNFGLDEKEKGPPTSAYMGKAMGTSSSVGNSGFSSYTGMADDDGFFSSLSHQPEFGSFK